jgi:hypothetical protein
VTSAGRHLLAITIVAVAVLLTAGFFVFARPEYRPANQGEQIKVPSEQPAADASGAAGWVWAKGTPGWLPGTMLGKHHDFNVSGVQEVELAAAQLAAAHAGLDANNVRVIQALRPNTRGPLAILAAPMLDETPARTCLLALLQGNAPLTWLCPGATTTTDTPRILVAATVIRWRHAQPTLDLAGVARGDVRRVVLDAPGVPPWELYTRGNSWGQFQAALILRHGSGRLLVYGDHGLVQMVRLELAPGEQRVFG